MKRLIIASLSVISSIITSFPTLHASMPPASPSSAYFKTFNSNQGLPDNSINVIEEDKLGFVWIGTWNGLARFDGKRMKCFRHESDNPSSITNNMVRSLLADEDGLWIGTDNGVDFFSYTDGIFHHCQRTDEDGNGTVPIQQRISRLIEKDGNILALGIMGDILRLDKTRSGKSGYPGLFVRVPRPARRRYADITAFTDGRILALSNEGVSLLSSDGKQEFRHTRIPARFDSNMNIFCDTVSMRLYIGSGIGAPASIYDINADGLLSINNSTEAVEGLMDADSDGTNVFLASDGGGLYVIRPDGSNIHYTPDNSSLPGDAIYAVHCDRRGYIWCGTYRQGLCMLSPELNRFTLNGHKSGALSYDIVTSVVPYGNKIYLGLDGGGIDIFDPASGRSRNINATNSALPGNNVTSIVHDGSTIWATIYSRGLAAIDPRTERISTYSIDNGHEDSNKLWVINDDGLGNIWVGGNSLHLFNKRTRSFRLVDECEDIMVMSIVDGGSYVWVATRQSGILQIDKATHRIISRSSDSPTSGGLRLPSAHVEFMFVDSQGILWISLGNEFCSFKRGSDKDLKFYGAANGLSDVRVYNMNEDADGNLWAGTANGLFRYVRSRDAFVRQDDSRFPTTFTHNSTAIYDNKIYFGTTAGLLSVPLTQENVLSYENNTVFTSVDILADGNPSIPLYSFGGTPVTLEHSQNFFTVNFTVPEMANPDQIFFECRLDGLEDVWRNVTETRSATYTNVPPGEYTMLVRHNTPDGSTVSPAEMPITILSPWYATTWALIMWTVSGCCIFILMIIFWRKYLLDREKANMAEVERDAARKLNDSKLDFYANITHELRTPCFLISAQIEEMLDSGRQSIPTASLNGIYRNATKLNKLINNILDFRKFDSGHIKLNGRRIELTGFFKEMSVDYEQLCRQKSLSYTYVHEDTPVEGVFDPDKLEMIATNLVSNAYKYTPDGGSVTLSVRCIGDDAVISVTDTGIGIVEKMRQAIFEPYFRTERGRRQSSGDGIGLALAKEFVELHGGRIEVESRVNEGSTFTVILPRNNPHESERKESEIQPATHQPRQIASPEENTTESAAVINNPTAIRSILIADDDPEVASLIARTFEGEYRVARACDGAEALEMARTGDFDVVVTDIMMPNADGHQLIAALKSDRRLRDIKVVVFSALTTEDDMLRAFDEGVDAYLHKPTPLKVLRRQIDRLFETPENHAAMPAAKTGERTYNREEQKFLLECRRIIDEHMLNEDFGIEMLAGKLAMSHSSLYKKIRRMTGMSLIDFINEYRIYKAVQLFRNGNTNVQKVAEMCGFHDIKTFRETFKRKMNMPPKQYILSLENGKA